MSPLTTLSHQVAVSGSGDHARPPIAGQPAGSRWKARRRQFEFAQSWRR